MCYDFIHTDVERLRRNFFYELKRETDAGFVCRGYAGKQSVVISLPASQTISVAVERYARNSDKVYCGVVGEQCSGRLLNAVCSRGKVCGACIDAKFQIVTYDDGQKYLFLCTPFSDEVVRIYFIR